MIVAAVAVFSTSVSVAASLTDAAVSECVDAVAAVVGSLHLSPPIIPRSPPILVPTPAAAVVVRPRYTAAAVAPPCCWSCCCCCIPLPPPLLPLLVAMVPRLATAVVVRPCHAAAGVPTSAADAAAARLLSPRTPVVVCELAVIPSRPCLLPIRTPSTRPSGIPRFGSGKII